MCQCSQWIIITGPKKRSKKIKNGVFNFDLPTALDEKLLSEDLKTLISGQTIEVKEYFFNAPVNTNKTVVIEPRDILIVEVVFVLF